MTCVQNTVILQLRSGLHLNLSKKKVHYNILSFLRVVAVHMCVCHIFDHQFELCAAVIVTHCHHLVGRNGRMYE